MRWARLFADLEAQWDAEQAAENAGALASQARFEVGSLGLAERMRATLGHPVRLSTTGAGQADGRLADLGTGWFLVAEAAGREALVNADAVTLVSGAGRYAEPGPGGAVARKLNFRHAIRGLARDRARIQVRLSSGQTVDGTFDRVGSDAVDLASHPAGEFRRSSEVREVLLLPLTGIAIVRRLTV